MLDDLTGVAPFAWPDLWLSAHTADPSETARMISRSLGRDTRASRLRA